MRRSVRWVIAIGLGLVISLSSRAEVPSTSPGVSKLPASADDTILYLARPSVEAADFAPALVFRELQRQALLMAARDGMGLHTRDEVLREFASTAHGPTRALQMDFHFDSRTTSWQTRTSMAGAASDAEEAAVPVSLADNCEDLLPSVEHAEIASREQWPKVLSSLGYHGSAPVENDGLAPAEVEDLLYSTSLFAPIAAVQIAHAAVENQGASPDRLCALVRGYANLGQLTHRLWSSDRPVFVARSLLYGQRMVVRWPKAPIAYWSRGYAEALAGLHAAALKDAGTAHALQPAGLTVPPWAELIEPLANYDAAALTDAIATDARRAPLAAFLTFVSIEQCGSDALVLQVGDATLQFNPSCFAILDAMCSASGVGPGAKFTVAAPAEMALTLPRDAKLLPEVPPGVRSAMSALSAATAANEAPDVVADVLAAAERSLVDADAVSAEPSFALAGRLAQETSFTHVRARVSFITDMYGWDGADYVNQIEPLVRDHPLRKLIDAYALPYGERPAALSTLAVDDPQIQMGDLIAKEKGNVPMKGRMSGSRLWKGALQDVDTDAYDFSAMLDPRSRADRNFPMIEIDALRNVSPCCPMVATARFRDHWADPAVQRDVVSWKVNYGQQPATLLALAAGLKKDNRIADAERVLEQYVNIAGDFSAASSLADLYLQDHDEVHWLATLQGVLDRPDYGLDHASANVQIANHYIARGEYRRALPYADEAEKSHAFWAMECDAKCHRALGNKARANEITQEARAHYGPS